MIVITGGRGTISSSLSTSSSSSSSSTSSIPINSTSKPNSPATSSITSASRRWLIDTIIPSPIHLPITSAKLTSIRLASSLTVTNSVTCSLLSSIPSAPRCSAASSLRALLSLDLAPLPPPREAPANLAWVSRILSCISFASISFTSRLSLLRSPFPWPPNLPPLCPCPCCLLRSPCF